MSCNKLYWKTAAQSCFKDALLWASSVHHILFRCYRSSVTTVLPLVVGSVVLPCWSPSAGMFCGSRDVHRQQQTAHRVRDRCVGLYSVGSWKQWVAGGTAMKPVDNWGTVSSHTLSLCPRTTKAKLCFLSLLLFCWEFIQLHKYCSSCCHISPCCPNRMHGSALLKPLIYAALKTCFVQGSVINGLPFASSMDVVYSSSSLHTLLKSSIFWAFIIT